MAPRDTDPGPASAPDGRLGPAGSPAARVSSFLRRVRVRLQRRALLRAAALWLAGTVGTGAALASAAAIFGPRPLWLPLSVLWLLGSAAALGLWVWRLRTPAAARTSDEEIARYVGARVPDLRSDLLSVVELCRPAPGPGPGQADATASVFVLELCRRTAAATATLEPRELVGFGAAWRAGVLAAAVSLLVIGLSRFIGLSQGLVTLFQLPPPNPVQLATAPLLGDLRLLLTYPRYTGLPQRTIPGSSGDVLALPGTQVRIEARALVPVERAQLRVLSSQPAGSPGQPGDKRPGAPVVTLPVQILRPDDKDAAQIAVPGADSVAAKTGGGGGTRYALLSVSFVAQQPGQYYFVLERPNEGPLREATGHRIDIEVDRPPRIDLFAPAAELEVTGVRRVELAYAAEDDFGLGDIDLVYRIGSGPEKKKRIRSAPAGASGAPPVAVGKNPPRRPRDADAAEAAPRAYAAKLEWDLSELELQTGARVVYHMEARDLDTVSGPNVGRSREYVLKIQSPREKLDALVQAEEQLRELGIQLLGDRLELGRALVAAPEILVGQPLPGPGLSPLALDMQERVVGVHRKAESFLLQVGRVQQDAGVPGGPKDLVPALQEIGRRLGRLTQDEEPLLGDLRNRRLPGGQAAKPRAGLGRDITTMNERHVTEMERDVILLDDLLGRQKLEELLAISDEMTALRDRMKQLLADYKKAPTEAARKELERELRAFERRLAELMDKARGLRGELPDEFLNREAMGQNDLQTRIDRLRDLIQKGDLAKAEAELERMSQALDGLVKGMEQNLRGFRGERFTAEEKALAELENRVSDLAHDQDDLKRRTEEVKQRASEKARQLLQGRAEALTKRLQGDLQRLRKLLNEADVAPLGSWGSDEMDKTQKRLDDLGRMLEQGDLEEARAMAQEAEQSIGKLEDELRAEEQGSRWGQRLRLGKSRARLEQARPIAKEIQNEIARALPRPEELLSPADRKQLGEIRGQQQALRRRGDQLGRDMQKRAQSTKDAPQLERLSQEGGELLRKAGSYMEQAEGELGRLTPRGAAAAQGQAAEQLGQMRKQMQQARRPQNEGAGMKSEREPVKIPGADEYRPPKEFRQDILDAAKREAPAEYREQVKRYYEELIQ